ncbi:hypothetical protein H4217_005302 [Coemansia sp. RSA 1939]|nr:hypothetical protein H4217_005302 [Coemansia sp. RSA 1939]
MVVSRVSVAQDDDLCKEVSSAQIAAANPDAEQADYCDDTDHTFDIRGECRTNENAYKSINKAIQKWEISKRGEVVATIAWMLYESNGWKNNIQHYPRYDPQVATRAMFSKEIVKDYAWDVKRDSYTYILTTVLSGQMPLSTAHEEIVRLVIEDEWSFGAGFWYLAKKAPEYHNQDDKLRSGSQDDFVNYMQFGVKANLTGSLDARLKWWQAANNNIMVS